MKICSFEGCGRKHYGRGLCAGHHRQQKLGKELRPLRAISTAKDSMIDRLEAGSVLNPETGCKEWTRSRAHNGYGQITVNGRTRQAHRVSWEEKNGPIPNDRYVDHLCHNRSCINVDHLRLVTRYENQANRGSTSSRSGYRGVYQVGRRWKTAATHQGETRRLGTFDTPEEAYEAVKAFWESQGIIYNSTEQRDLWEEVTA